MNKVLALFFLVALSGGIYQYVQTDRELRSTKAALAEAQARIDELQIRLDNPMRDPRLAQEQARLQRLAQTIEEGRKGMLAVYADLSAWRDQLAEHQRTIVAYEARLTSAVSEAVREGIAQHDRESTGGGFQQGTAFFGDERRGQYESQADYEKRMVLRRLAYLNSPQVRLRNIEQRLSDIQDSLLRQQLGLQ